MNGRNLIYLGLLFMGVLIAAVTLGLYYSQNFTEEFSYVDEIRLVDVQIQAYDQNNYNYNYNCKYNEFNQYVCNNTPNTTVTKVLQSATVQIGYLDLENKGFFTQVYTPPRLIGCVTFNNPSTSNGLRFPREFSIEYRNDAPVTIETERPAYGYDYGYYYGSEPAMLEIKPGKKEQYRLIAHYTPYSIPLDDFTKSNIKEIVIYRLPAKVNNPLANEYAYDSFYYNPTCENAEAKDVDPVATIKIA